MRLCGFLLAFAIAVAPIHCQSTATASAKMTGMFNYTGSLGGTLFFQESGGGVRITGSITGLSSGNHGFHIHSTGDLSNNCSAAGAHYNPLNTTHGGLNTTVRHLGDIGNVLADSTGTVYVNVNVPNITLTSFYSVLNRTITIHEDFDDLGLGNFSDSLTTGHSGRRVGCGIILASSPASMVTVGWISLLALVCTALITISN